MANHCNDEHHSELDIAQQNELEEEARVQTEHNQSPTIRPAVVKYSVNGTSSVSSSGLWEVAKIHFNDLMGK